LATKATTKSSAQWVEAPEAIVLVEAGGVDRLVKLTHAEEELALPDAKRAQRGTTPNRISSD